MKFRLQTPSTGMFTDEFDFSLTSEFSCGYSSCRKFKISFDTVSLQPSTYNPVAF